jgi:hypothetical protein
VSVDGSTYVNANVFPTLPFRGTSQATITANNEFLLSPQGGQSAEVCGNTVASGTAVVTVNATPASTLRFSRNEMTGQTPAAAPEATAIIGGQFNSAAPAPSTGQTLPLQQDAAGSTYVSFRSSTNGCASNNGAIASIPVNASTTSAVQVVALSAGKKIYVCAITILGGGTTPTFSLESGTGTNCGTGNTVLTQPMAISTTVPTSFPGTVAVTAAGGELCIHLGGTSPTAVGVLSYVQ